MTVQTELMQDSPETKHWLLSEHAPFEGDVQMLLVQIEPETAQSTASSSSQALPGFDFAWQKPERQESVDDEQKLSAHASPVGERHFPEGQVDPPREQSAASSQSPPEGDLSAQVDEMQAKGEMQLLLREHVAPSGEKQMLLVHDDSEVKQSSESSQDPPAAGLFLQRRSTQV